MPDRIEELVAAIDANTLLQWDGRDVALEAARELAREAEKWRKVAEWLAKRALLADGFVRPDNEAEAVITVAIAAVEGERDE